VLEASITGRSERMQNSDSYKLRSISRTLSVGLIITLVLVAGLSLVVNYIFSSSKAKAELETRVEDYISALTVYDIQPSA